MKKLLLSAALLVSAGAIFGAAGERTRPTPPPKPANLGNFTVINNSGQDVYIFGTGIGTASDPNKISGLDRFFVPAGQTGSAEVLSVLPFPLRVRSADKIFTLTPEDDAIASFLGSRSMPVYNITKLYLSGPPGTGKVLADFNSPLGYSNRELLSGGRAVPFKYISHISGGNR